MYRYRLETGPSSLRKFNCPHCHRRSFTRYVDTETGQYIDDSCGRCDHEQSCGYHLSPSDFFSQHPGWKHDTNLHARLRTPRQPPLPRPLCTLSMDLVERCHKPSSYFTHWMASLVDDKQRAKRVWELYRLGATPQHEVIFWQIDEKQRVRSGKIMQYTNDGHRTGHPRWMHTSLKADGELPQDWTLTQCLFGEHLLPQYPDKPVCIVESEKTAVCMAMFAPDFVWLATGGCNNLKFNDIESLRNRRIILYPDSGEYNKWYTQAMESPFASTISVVNFVEQYPPNTDLLDLLLLNHDETAPTDETTNAPAAEMPAAEI